MKLKTKLFSILGITPLLSISPLSNTQIVQAATQDVSINNYYVQNVTDEGFDFYINFNSSEEIPSLNLAYWKNGNYYEMKWMSAEKIGRNQFKAHIKMRDIGSGTEYVYLGLHPIINGNDIFIADIPIKLDTIKPNLNVGLSNSNWTNKNIYINANSSDNMNIVERMSFTNKNNQKSYYDLYSNPKILLIKGFDVSAVGDYIGNRTNVTTIQGDSINSVNQLKGYDIVIYDGAHWEMKTNVAPILNQAFEDGVSIITNFNDDYENISIGNGNTTITGGTYTFSNYSNNNSNYMHYLNGRLNRFAYLMDGKSESDGAGYRKIYAGNDAFIISTVTHNDGTQTPGVLMETHSSGNKWIHFQAANLPTSSGALFRAMDEIMHGTMKTRQNYNKSFEISENGTYVIESEDFSGNITSKSITVSNIDKNAPTIDVSGVPTKWVNSATLTVSAADDLSGITQIILPNGSAISGNSANYVVKENGNYTFRARDAAGNETVKTVNVSLIDNTINDITNVNGTTTIIDKNTSKRRMEFSYSGIVDSQSGFKGYSYVIDKNPNTIPDNVVDTTSTKITQDITDTGVYYLHIKALDNAGNSSNVIHHKMDIPNLKAVADNINNKIRLDWTMEDVNNKTFKIYQKKPESNEFQTISSTNLDISKKVNVLNVYPNVGTPITFKTWDGETLTLPASASLKKWMEEPNPESPKGYGKGLIEVAPITIDEFNANPNLYLKNPDGSWKYDVIMFGTYDNNGGKDLTTSSLEATKEFIESGKGVLFGHDTVTQWTNRINFPKLEEYINTKTYGFNGNGTPEDMWTMPWSGGTEVAITKKGLLTNYPWKIGDIGTKLTIPYTHTNSQITKGDIWMKFSNPKPDPETQVPIDVNEYTDNGVGSNMAYLTTWNNVSMVQTGHAIDIYNATPDEQKLLANTLFYLNQLSTDNFLDDYSGQDVTPPNKVSNITHSFTDDGFININFNQVNDNGSIYEYYVESQTKDNNSLTISNVVKTEIKAGLKGYSYVIDNNPNTIPDNKIEQVSNNSIKIKTNSKQELYLHIKAIDNADNSSEVVHYNITDITPPILSETISPNTWTNKDVTITVVGSDVGSGIKEIITPNGIVVKGNVVSFVATKNGLYSFKAVDFMGNETIKSINITNIDKNKPTVNIINNQNWTNQNVQVDITAEDN